MGSTFLNGVGNSASSHLTRSSSRLIGGVSWTLFRALAFAPSLAPNFQPLPQPWAGCEGVETTAQHLSIRKSAPLISPSVVEILRTFRSPPSRPNPFHTVCSSNQGFVSIPVLILPITTPPCPSIEKDTFTIPKSPCIHTADIYIPHLILTCRPHALYCRLIPGQDPRPFVSPTTSLPISLSAPHPHFPISPSQSPAPPSPLHSHSTYQPNSAYPFP